MSKKQPLSHGQRRRLHANHQKRLNRSVDKNQTTPLEDSSLEAEQTGIVISRFGQHADIETSDGVITRCNIRRTIESLVCGDKVQVRLNKDRLATIAGVVEAVYPRSSWLSRPDLYDGVKIIAANIDQILITSAIVPEFSTQIIDRYLIAAETTNIPPIILVNKMDLLEEDKQRQLEQNLSLYQDLNYPVYRISANTEEGIESLQNLLKNKISVFVGQSGVGKSSIVNSLLPEAQLSTGDVSETSGLGQHTTTSAKLLHLPSGGSIIDSPGVREFALWHLTPEQVARGFIEFRQYLGCCKFRDCKHGDDPGCALQQAVKDGKITNQRFTNYHKIIASLSELRHARQFRADNKDL